MKEKFSKDFNFKILNGVILIALLISIITPSLIYPKLVKAQVVSAPVLESITLAKAIWDKIQAVLTKAWEWGGAIAYHNALRMVLSKMAQDTAEWISSGFHGRPAFLTEPLGEYWKHVGDQALGEFVDKLAQDTFLKAGVSLCEPIDPTLKFRMLLSIPGVPLPPGWEPTQRTLCSFREIRDNLREAFRKDLLDISFQIQQGQGFKFEKELITLIDVNEVLAKNKELKEALKGNTINLQDLQRKILYITEYAQRELNKAFRSPAERQEFVNRIIKDIKDAKVKLDAIEKSIIDIQDLINDCSLKSQQEFCNTPACYKKFCDEGLKCYDESSYGTCLSILHSADKFGSHFAAWVALNKKNLEKIEEAVRRNQALKDEDLARAETLEDLVQYFKPEANDLGRIFLLQMKALEEQSRAQEWEITEIVKNQGWFNKMSDISKRILTPSTLIDEKTRRMVEKGEAGILQTTGVAMADAAQIIINSLINKLLTDKIFGRGFNLTYNPQEGFKWKWFPLKEGVAGVGGATPSQTESKEAVKTYFADLATVTLKRGGELNILEKFMICPEDTKYALPENCVADSGLVRAVQENLTIKEAIERDLLHGDWLVGGLNVKDTAKDYTYRYSLTNIKKLRAARIFPLGLEIAAEKISSGELSATNYTLKQIVDGFDNPNSPFYRLVNPNWVLKVPASYCETVAYSAIPVAGSSERQETCIDLKTCILEDEKGNCKAYGYCTREKNIWRFDGDECLKQFASCQKFTRTKDNKTFTYLKNTLDFDDCDENTSGCKWYCKDYGKKLSANNQDIWACKEPGKNLIKCTLNSPCQNETCSCTKNGKTCQVPKNGTQCWITVDAPSNVIYFNRKVEKCDRRAIGCHEYIRIKPGLETNLLPNGEFKLFAEDAIANDDNEDTIFGWQRDCWPGGAVPPEQRCNTQNQEGNPKVYLVSPGAFDDYAAKLEVSYKNVSGDWAAIGSVPIEIDPQPYPRYFAYSAWFYVPSKVGEYNNVIKGTFWFGAHAFKEGCTSTECLVDGEIIKEFPNRLINNETERDKWLYKMFIFKANPNVKYLATWLSVGDGEGQGVVYIDQVQIAELTDEDSPIPNYHEYGTINRIYLKKAPDWLNCYDENPNNDDITCKDYAQKCRKEEVGCELYYPITGDFPIPAIASANDKCPSECQGYEIFKEMPSNFDPGRDLVMLIPTTANVCPASEVGCEEFTNLDEIQKGGEAKEYYTYLRPCQKEDETRCQYFYTWVGSDTTGYQLKRYYLLKGKNGPDEFMNYEDAKKLWGECDSEDDILTNPHCKQFFDAEGKSYFRLYENTISCSNDCHPLRKTTPVSKDYCPTKTSSGNQLIGASYENGICTYMAIPSQGLKCSKKNAGCREYKGNAAYNIKKILFDDFETGTVENWSNGEISTESINFGGHSLKVGRIHIDSFSQTEKYIKDLVEIGNSYLISFWVKGKGTYKANFDNLTFGSKEVITDEWQEIKLGPLYLNKEIENLIITGPETFFIDKILLKAVKQNLYLIKDSWSTPKSCDIPTVGAMLGCRAYRDRFSKVHYLKSFSSLCKEEAVGCEALIDTQNSSFPFKEEFNKNGSPFDDVVIDKDRLVYLVNDPKKYCQAQDKGCQFYGLPNLDRNNNVIGWEDVYLKNDPDLYKSKPILCQEKDLGCEEYISENSNSPIYFKDPNDKLCEYKEKVKINGQDVSGWFKKGTNEPCYKDYLPDGLTYGIRWSNDVLYEGWVGICPADQSGCTQFLTFEGPVIFEEDFEKDEILNKYSTWCGGVSNGCSPGSRSVNLDSVEKFHGDKSIKVAVSSQCEEKKDDECQLADTILGRVFKEADLSSLNLKPETIYTISAYGKITHDNGWYILVRERYYKKDNQGNLLAKEIGSKEKCEARNNNALPNERWWWETGSNLGTHCVHDVFSNKVFENEWRINQVQFYIRGQDFSGLGQLEIMLRSPAESGSNLHYDYLQIKTSESYYYLNNNKLDKSSCKGQVSREEGCALFLDTSLRQKNGLIPTYYNSFATYKKSEANNYKPVPPIDCTKGKPPEGKTCNDNDYNDTDYCKYCPSSSNDANLILKVKRDRVCGEWLACAGFQTVWDKASGQEKEICEQLIRCRKLAPTGDLTQCLEPVIIDPKEAKVLDEKEYKNRDISFSGMDYSGFSLYNFYPLELLEAKKFGDEYYLTFLDNQNISRGVGGKSCNNDNDCPIGQVCKNNYCVIPKTCKAYPEKETPYASSVKKEFYTSVNHFENEDLSGLYKPLGCLYKKVDYGGITRYFDPSDTRYGNPPDKTCEKEFHKECGNCNDPANCPFKKRKETEYLGLTGYCLEPDRTKPIEINACLTYWPTVASAGDRGLYDWSPEAGYIAASDRSWYCGMKEDGFVVDPETYKWVFALGERYGNTDGCKWLQCDNEKENCTKTDEDNIGYTDWASYDSNQAYKNIKGCYRIDGGRCDTVEATLKYYFLDHSINGYTNPIIPRTAIKEISIKPRSRDGGYTTCHIGNTSGWSGLDWLSVCENNRKDDTWGENTRATCSDNYKSKWSGDKDYIHLKLEWREHPILNTHLENNLIRGPALDLIYKDGSLDDGGFIIEDFHIDFKPYCYYAYKIADQDGITKAWTNRIKINSSTGGPYENANLDIPWDYGCAPYGAIGRGEISEYNTEDPNGTIITETIPESGERSCSKYTGHLFTSLSELQKIFAKGYELMKFSKDLDFKWQSVTSTAFTPPSPQQQPDHITPQIRPVLENGLEATSSGVTINGVYDKDIIANGALFAVMKFYAWADKNHMPIREIVVDWGDGTVVGENVNLFAKNRRAKCDVDKEGFGGSKDACKEWYFQRSHFYTCYKNGPGWDEGQKACIFKPKVYIKDNWGWCANYYGVVDDNGSCLGRGGVPFQGKIKIYPLK